MILLCNPVATYPWHTGVVLALAGVGTLLVQLRGGWHPEFVLSEFVLTLLGVTAVLATTRLKTFLDSSLSALAEVVALPETPVWVTKQKQFAFQGVAPLIVATIVSIAAVVTIHIAWVPWHGVTLWTFYGAMVLVFAAVGQLCWSFGAILVILYRASQIDVVVEIFAWPRAALRILTRCYLNTCVVGIVLYMIAVVAVWIGPGGSWFLMQDQGPVRQLWVLPMATIVVAYLLICQILLYWIAHRVHEQRLTDLSILAQSRLNEFLKTLEPDTASAVSDLLKWRESVEREKVRSFNVRAFGTMIVTVVLPAAKTIKELLGW